jgi:hypothetical protein
MVNDIPWPLLLRSLVSLQLALSPMVVFAVGIEDALTMPMHRLQHSHLGEDHRTVIWVFPVLPKLRGPILK